MSTQVTLDLLVETIAKALCFERYIAEHDIKDPEDMDLTDILDFYEEHDEEYLNKAYELMVLVENSDEYISESETLH